MYLWMSFFDIQSIDIQLVVPIKQLQDLVLHLCPICWEHVEILFLLGIELGHGGNLVICHDLGVTTKSLKTYDGDDDGEARQLQIDNGKNKTNNTHLQLRTTLSRIVQKCTS